MCTALDINFDKDGHGVKNRLTHTLMLGHTEGCYFYRKDAGFPSGGGGAQGYSPSP